MQIMGGVEGRGLGDFKYSVGHELKRGLAGPIRAGRDICGSARLNASEGGKGNRPPPPGYWLRDLDHPSAAGRIVRTRALRRRLDRRLAGDKPASILDRRIEPRALGPLG